MGEVTPMAGKKKLFEVGQGDGAPEIVREVADEELVDQVDGPEDVMDDQQDQGVVVVPADHECIKAEDGV
jgi:hypothetical protein